MDDLVQYCLHELAFEGELGEYQSIFLFVREGRRIGIPHSLGVRGSIPASTNV